MPNPSFRRICVKSLARPVIINVGPLIIKGEAL